MQVLNDFSIHTQHAVFAQHLQPGVGDAMNWDATGTPDAEAGNCDSLAKGLGCCLIAVALAGFMTVTGTILARLAALCCPVL